MVRKNIYKLLNIYQIRKQCEMLLTKYEFSTKRKKVAKKEKVININIFFIFSINRVQEIISTLKSSVFCSNNGEYLNTHYT